MKLYCVNDITSDVLVLLAYCYYYCYCIVFIIDHYSICNVIDIGLIILLMIIVLQMTDLLLVIGNLLMTIYWQYR